MTVSKAFPDTEIQLGPGLESGLPLVVWQKGGDSIFIDTVDQNERDSYFNHWKISKRNRPEYKTTLCFLINTKAKRTNNFEDHRRCNELKKYLDLAIYAVLGWKIKMHYFSGTLSGGGRTDRAFHSTRKERLLSKDLISRISKIISAYEQPGRLQKKLDRIQRFYYFVGANQPGPGKPTGFECAAYFSILEIIYIPECDSDSISTKLAFRVTAHDTFLRKQKIRIKELYSRRSKFVHRGENKFEYQDTIDLERLVSRSVELLVSQPNFFEEDVIDDVLFE